MRVTGCSENTTGIKVTREHGKCVPTVKPKGKRMNVNVVLRNPPNSIRRGHDSFGSSARTEGGDDESLEPEY
jgi:hypothetical protein